MSGHFDSLIEARTWLRSQLDDGARCPCCTQFAKVYRRRIHATMARLLITAWRQHGTMPFHAPTTIGGLAGGDWAKLSHWGLLEEMAQTREDGGHAGYWRVTDKGAAWVQGRTTVLMYARIYDGRCLGLTGDPVTIHDALGKRFDYRELMAA